MKGYVHIVLIIVIVIIVVLLLVFASHIGFLGGKPIPKPTATPLL
jgi:hypothetical protein